MSLSNAFIYPFLDVVSGDDAIECVENGSESDGDSESEEEVVDDEFIGLDYPWSYNYLLGATVATLSLPCLTTVNIDISTPPPESRL